MMIKTIPVIVHGDKTPPGLVVPELKHLGFVPQLVHLHRGEALPVVESFDHLVICGGAPNVDETSKYPFLKNEMTLIEKTLAAGKNITGICLGAQLCAHVLGAKVYAHPRGWEIGWYDVEVLPPAVADSTVAMKTEPLATNALPVFQHHRYVFEKPDGAVTLARNSWWECQAYTWKNQIMAFQFHPETDVAWINQCAHEKHASVPTGNVQTGAQMIEQTSSRHPESSEWFARALAISLKQD